MQNFTLALILQDGRLRRFLPLKRGIQDMRLISFGKSRSSICHNWRRFYNMHTDFMVGTSMWPQNLWEIYSWENHFAIVIVGHDVRPTYVTFLQRVCCCWCLLENAHACCQVCLCLYIVCTAFFSSFSFDRLIHLTLVSISRRLPHFTTLEH